MAHSVWSDYVRAAGLPTKHAERATLWYDARVVDKPSQEIPELREIGAGVFAYLQQGSWGYSNAGLIRGHDSSLLVDTLYAWVDPRIRLT